MGKSSYEKLCLVAERVGAGLHLEWRGNRANGTGPGGDRDNGGSARR